MFINDVVRYVDKHLPNEYSVEDKYIWCNELSAMIITEDRKCYFDVYLSPDEYGVVLLPEYVTLEYIISIEADGKEYHKYDCTAVSEFSQNRIKIDFRGRVPEAVHIVYQLPYIPIRMVKYSGTALLMRSSDNSKPFQIYLKNCEFLVGDDVILIDGENTKYRAVIEHIYVDEEFKYDYPYRIDLRYNGENTVVSYPKSSKENISVQRYVTDSTICPPPFDTMYIDWIMAKICELQHDTQGYNQHISAYNSKLANYRIWLVDKLPHSKGTFEAWW